MPTITGNIFNVFRYKRLALIYHPDKIDEENCDGLTKTFHDIAEAYETLSDGPQIIILVRFT